MTSIKIDDLETSIELDQEALSAVSGGMGMGNMAMQAGIADASVTNVSGGGFLFGSPTIITNVPVSVQTVNQNDNDLDLDISNYTANILGSALTSIGQ